MSDNKDELRREKRFSGKHSILVCYPSQDGSEKEEKHACKTEDISEGGLKIMTSRPLPLGCTLPIDIHILDQDSVFKFKGEVKWCLEVDPTPTYFAGIKLLKLVDNNYQQWRNIANDK